MAKWPDIGATTNTLGWGGAPGLAKRKRLAKGVLNTTSSSTGTAWPSTITGLLRQAGRSWVSSASAITLQAAAARRKAGTRDSELCGSSSIGVLILAMARSGHISSECAW